MTDSRKGKRILFAFLLFVGILLIAFGMFLICYTSDHMQYIKAAESSESDLHQQYSIGEDIRKSITEYGGAGSIDFRMWEVSVGTDNGENIITVYGIDKYYFGIYHETLTEGRLISDRDIREAGNVIVIDQSLAYHLFPGGDAIGRTLRMGKREWTVIGLIRTVPRFGEVNDSVAYIPITTLGEYPFQPQTLEIHLQKGENTPTAVLKNMIMEKAESGTWIYLSAEKIKAMMPLRLITVALLCFLICQLLRKSKSYAKNSYSQFRDKLTEKYAVNVIGWIVFRSLIFLMIWIVICGAVFATAWLIRQVVLTFPEWIPDKPFSLQSYIRRFWFIHHEESVGIQYLSHDLSTIQLGEGMIRIGCIGFLAGCWIGIQRKKFLPVDSSC